jgi:hypothetical protein
MIKPRLRRLTIALAITVLAVSSFLSFDASAQRRRRPAQHLSVCGNPNLPCKSFRPFDPFELQFRIAENAVIWDTELFYAVMLKSVKTTDDNCDVFVPENDRLAAQTLFPNNKVFASRCFEPGGISYTNTSSKAHFMAVYAGNTLAQANRMLATVQATGKYPSANIRRMRATVNGT